LIETTLEAAGIPSERCGKARTAHLNEREFTLYAQMLNAFAATGRPPANWVRDRATALKLDPDDAFAVLAVKISSTSRPTGRLRLRTRSLGGRPATA
jgi:hypothetical protein